MREGLKARFPWWLRLGAKWVLARTNVPVTIWQRLGVFRDGPMKDSGYCRAVFQRHWTRCREAQGPSWQPQVALELGPGESLFGAALAKAHGLDRTWLVDAVDHATWSTRGWQGLRAELPKEAAPWDQVVDRSSLLSVCSARFLTGGIEAWTEIPDGTIDFLWSQAVLEHIPLGEVDAVLAHMRRVLAPGGIASHRVDLKDHLGGGLAHLRFSEARWESRSWMRSGFYTNRIRVGEWIQRFERAGFRAEVVRQDAWARLPAERGDLDPAFRSLPDAELKVSGFDVLLRPS